MGIKIAICRGVADAPRESAAFPCPQPEGWKFLTPEDPPAPLFFLPLDLPARTISREKREDRSASGFQGGP